MAGTRLIGGFRAGKTSALLDRAAAASAAGTTFALVCASRPLADRAESALAERLGALRDLRVTTFTGLGLDAVTRWSRVEGLASWRSRLRIVAELRDDAWPVTDAEVLRAIDALTRSMLGEQELSVHADAAGQRERWEQLWSIAHRYRARLESRRLCDPAAAIVDGTRLLREQAISPWELLLVDDGEQLTQATFALAVATRAPVTIAVNPGGPGAPAGGPTGATPWWQRLPAAETVVLDGHGTRAKEERATRTRVRAHHRALEGEAVAGQLRAWKQAGDGWGNLAVLCPHHDALAAVARSCARHGIPTTGAAAAGSPDHPVVLAALAAGHERAASTAARLVGTYLDDDGALALLRDLAGSGGSAGAWAAELRAAAGPGASASGSGLEIGSGVGAAVTLGTIDAAAGRSWKRVVLAGAVEGALPRNRPAAPFFDGDVLEARFGREPHERRRLAVEHDRRRFCLAVSRADAEIVAVSAPEPGVLVSRFVEPWPEADVVLPSPDPAAAVAALALTPGTAPIWPDRALRLSATQIAAYENCPLSFAFQYGLGARGEGGVQARVGSLTHAILEEFLHPDNGDRSLAQLQLLADQRWDPSIFDYRPQASDYRRRLDTWLASWWEREGQYLGTDRRVVAVEHRFLVTVGPHTLTGSIDRVDVVDDGIEIVDYKTGSKPPGTVDENNLQLAVYHLAAVRDPAIAAHGPPRRLRLHYLADGKDIDQPITEDHEQRTEARILAVADAILDEHYPPSVRADCQYCEFQRLCPLKDSGRHVGERTGAVASIAQTTDGSRTMTRERR